MNRLLDDIALAKQNNEELFYNNSGSKKAYQLGVKHISFSEDMGFSLSLPNGDLQIKKEFLLVDFEKNKIIKIYPKERISPVKLKFL